MLCQFLGIVMFQYLQGFSCFKKSLYSVNVFLSEERSKKYEIKVCAVSIFVSGTLLHARLKEGIEHLSIE